MFKHILLPTDGSALSRRAAAAGVPFEGLQVTSEYPAAAIVQVASQHNCDLIVMASHGHKGMKGLLLGSETAKVLAHANVPVMVHR